MSVESRLSIMEQQLNIISSKVKILEEAEDIRSNRELIRDWVYSTGRYLLPFGLMIATFILGKYG